ncbi:MAG TPA: hypothetical protein ENO24_04425 [Chloroflexi bacterium]|nr:hypothetical protein [Chloroflexota bacterium]
MNPKARKALILSTLLLLLLVALARDSLHPADYFQFRTDPFTGSHRFDWGSYELHTIVEKVLGRTLGIDQPHGTDRETQVQLVRDYFSLVQEIGRLESEIAAERAREGESADTATLQGELAARRTEREQQENLVENIIRGQVEEVLLSQGITSRLPLVRGLVVPPVEFEFQSSPDFLIVSRRDRIERIGTVSLQPHLSLARIEEIEALTDELGVSSLVVPTGGVGSYPTVIVENTSLDFAIRVVIHEWTHNYLYFHPLGQHYADSHELTSMNEAVACMVEEELSLELARRYYPDIYERRMADLAREQAAVPSLHHEDQFSFNAIMRKTRISVEALLELGKVEEAEEYMEQRRQKLVGLGYGLRKLNQAYFAFYGSYSAGKGWAAETNPVGAQMKMLREASPTLADFLNTVAGMGTYQDLLDRLQHL